MSEFDDYFEYLEELSDEDLQKELNWQIGRAHV